VALPYLGGVLGLPLVGETLMEESPGFCAPRYDDSSSKLTRALIRPALNAMQENALGLEGQELDVGQVYGHPGAVRGVLDLEFGVQLVF